MTADRKNKFIHTADDVIEQVSFSHMSEYVKLTVGFVYELAMTPRL